MAEPIQSLVGQCVCAARFAATRHRFFEYRFNEPIGWAFKEGALRKNGEPVIHFSCPWCGHDLSPLPSPYTQADGWDKGEGDE